MALKSTGCFFPLVFLAKLWACFAFKISELECLTNNGAELEFTTTPSLRVMLGLNTGLVIVTPLALALSSQYFCNS